MDNIIRGQLPHFTVEQVGTPCATGRHGVSVILLKQHLSETYADIYQTVTFELCFKVLDQQNSFSAPEAKYNIHVECCIVDVKMEFLLCIAENPPFFSPELPESNYVLALLSSCGHVYTTRGFL